jgi:hypothetical protein
VHAATLRGETLEFGREGPLVRNNQPEPITGFKHYDNPYCTSDIGATTMEIKHGEWMLRLNLDTGD